jgi:hypothetical protein
MRTFDCPCGNKLYFENTVCLQCGGALGYLPDRREMARIEPGKDGLWRSETADGVVGNYRKCRNYEHSNTCNWMVPADDSSEFCHACRLNSIIPDLSIPENLRLWFRIEQAKRRLIYTLDMLELPVFGKSIDARRGLSFEFLRDPIGDHGEFYDEMSGRQRIMTGHKTGIVTINVAEADPGARERMRERMGEAYRTLLGHFRHEIAHYYWDLLVRNTEYLEPVRALFGDESQDYATALADYYANGPSAGWPDNHISAYASAHPWEDWAESWAHYLHMADTLETASDQGLSVQGRPIGRSMPGQRGQPGQMDSVLADWAQLTDALNMLNRSMGLPDAYPFAVGPIAGEKLRLIDEIIANAGRVAPPVLPPSRNGAAPKGRA